MGMQRFAPQIPAYKPEPPAPAATSGLNAKDILESLQAILDENKRLEKENAQLKAAMAEIEKLVVVS